MWVRIKDSGQEVDMAENATVYGPGARQLIALGTAEAIDPPKSRPAEKLPVIAAPDLRDDREKAVDICHYIGLPIKAVDLVLRLIEAEQRIVLLEGDIASERQRFYKLDARVRELEAQTKKEQDHGQTEQSTSTARNGSGQTRGRLSAIGR